MTLEPNFNDSIRPLLFRVAGDAAPALKTRLADLIEILAASRPWLIGPPVYVEEIEDAEPPDEPVEIVGGLLPLHSALPPHRLPADIERQELESVEFIVAALMDFSSRHQVEFELQLGPTAVGSIQDGKPDRSLQVGLLDEWRKSLGVSPTSG